MRTLEHTLTDAYGRGIIRSYHSVLSPQRREYREHHHTECELSVFFAGSGTYAVHGKEYAFAAENVFLFGSNEAHCITEVTSEMDLLNIHFEPRLLWENSDTAELLSLFAARSSSFQNLFADQSGKLRGMLQQLEQELRLQQSCCAVAAKYLLFSILAQMIRDYPCTDARRAVSAPSSQTRSMRHAIDHIQQNLDKHLSLRELADIACMTPTYFSAVFKRLNGVSPWEYITIKRVEKAVEMLKGTEMTKLEIAEACGFSSSSNFYKAFLQVTGKRPGDYAPKK